MGRPKGLCRVPGRKESFIATLGRLYHQSGFSVAVVTTGSGLEAYQGKIPDSVPVEWIVGLPGQDTAWSVFLAWKHLGGRATQLWLHPVDLPLVLPDTLTLLMAESEHQPDRVLRPVYQDQEGHPVVLPVKVLAQMEPLWSATPTGIPGPMRELLNSAAQRELIQVPVLVTVQDAGIVRDFDRPADLQGEEPQERQPSDGK